MHKKGAAIPSFISYTMKLFEGASINVCAAECVEIILQLLFAKGTVKANYLCRCQCLWEYFQAALVWFSWFFYNCWPIKQSLELVGVFKEAETFSFKPDNLKTVAHVPKILIYVIK